MTGIRLSEAKTLLDSGHYAGAYYLTGYALECALKSAVARQVRQHDFPDKALANKSYTHNLLDLLKLAGLESQLSTERQRSPIFAAKWALVKDWDVESRYTPFVQPTEARDMFAATALRGGILPWIKRRW